MKKRLLFKLSGALAIILFFVFSLVEVKNSILFFLVFIIPLVIIRFIEVVCFFVKRKSFIKLGERELFDSNIRSIVKGFCFVAFLFFVLKFSNYTDIKPNDFSVFFIGASETSKYFYAFLFVNLIMNFVDDNMIFYVTKTGLLSKANYFEDYLWKEFKSYKLIEEQSLIRFTKKNDKFLFVKYEESYFQKRKIEITEVLNKNIPYV